MHFKAQSWGFGPKHHTALQRRDQTSASARPQAFRDLWRQEDGVKRNPEAAFRQECQPAECHQHAAKPCISQCCLLCSDGGGGVMWPCWDVLQQHLAGVATSPWPMSPSLGCPTAPSRCGTGLGIYTLCSMGLRDDIFRQKLANWWLFLLDWFWEKEWPKECPGFEFWVAERSFRAPIAKTHPVVVGCLLHFLHGKTSKYFRWDEIFTIKRCQWEEIQYLLRHQQLVEWCPPILNPSSPARGGREILLLGAKGHWEVHTTTPPCQHPLPRALETIQNV